MMPRLYPILMLATFFCALCAAVSAAERAFPEYRVGETSRVDIVAPFPIVSVDRDKTAELKLKEGQKTPAVFRLDTNVSARVLAAFHERIAAEHERFSGAMITAFRKSSIDPRAAGGQQFQKLLKTYQGTVFQLPSPLARAWATNGDDTEFIKAVEEHLRTNSQRFIRPDELPQECNVGFQMRLVPAEASNTLTLSAVEKSKLTLRRGEILPLEKVRSEFMKRFPQDQRALARWAASLLAPNCLPEEDLTREWRARRTQDIWSVTRFEPGETIARSGDVITATTKVALDELRVRVLAAEAQKSKNPWPLVCAVIGGAGAIGAVLVFWIVRKRRSTAMALQLAEPALVNADPIIRAQVADRLARLLGHTLVQRLFADRNHLLETQAETTVQTRVIEERIESIQAQVQERYRDYERRIVGLEAELTAATEENRDLIRAKISLAKQEMASEMARNRLTLN